MEFAYLSTTGRRTGRPHVIEVWYGERGGVIYLLSGGGTRSDWVRNLLADPHVRVRLGGARRRTEEGAVDATARLVADPAENAAARRLLAGKYQGWTEGAQLSEWAQTATVVAVDGALRPH